MARWKNLAKRKFCKVVASWQCARNGDLRLPSAVVEIRKGLGMTQEAFAKMLALTRSQVAEIEAVGTNPTLETLEKIGRLLGYSVGFPEASRHAVPASQGGEATN